MRATRRSLGVEPVRTSFRSPWQNGVVERFIGAVRRELLDYVIVVGEGHLRALLPPRREPAFRDRVGGLHRRYVWRRAA